MPRFPTLSLPWVLLALVPACTTYRYEYPVGDPSYELARRSLEGGGEEVFRLDTQVASGDAWLRVRTERERERPFLGAKIAEIDKAEAERRGVKPYSGLLVTGTDPDSPARTAGMTAGDVLLSLDGRAVVYDNQLPEVLATLQPGAVATAQVLRGQQALDLPLTIGSRKERIADDESVPLERPALTGRPYAGFELRGIPALWGKRVFGAERSAIVITTVQVGSPAWLAGMRGGDLIEAVDGAEPPSFAAFCRLIADRGVAGETVRLRVGRGDGPKHEADVHLHDYSGTTEFNVPLLVNVEDGVAEDRWSLLLGLLMGNRNRYVPDHTREVRTENNFSALLGLIQVKKSPSNSRVRLLWFITFNS